METEVSGVHVHDAAQTWYLEASPQEVQESSSQADQTQSGFVPAAGGQ